jgi:hypothetical protein
MPDSLDDLFDTNSADPGQGGGGQLRKQLEAVLAQNKTLQEQLAQVAARERTTSLNALFTKHAIPELARDFFPADADLSDEAATAFVEKYGALWGAQAAPAATPPAEQAATQAAQQFVSQAAPAPVAPLSEEEYAAKFAEAKTKDEFLKMLAELSAAGA